MDHAADVRGRRADRPTQIPARGWKDILVRVKQEAKQDDVSLLGGGVAFFALLALVPALVAVVSIYGLVADQASVIRQVQDTLGTAPREVREMVTQQLQSIIGSSSSGAGIAAVVGIVVALWSASSGMSHLIGAVNLAYDEEEDRGFVKMHALSLTMTLGAIVFLLVSFGIIALVPALVAKTGLGTAARVAIGIVRWVVLLAGMLIGLAFLYRYGPARDEPKWSWASPGAIFATAAWLALSIGFSIYTANFGRYNETYGTLGAIVVTMLWLYLTAVAVILGAELNAEMERQTARDTTRGPARPLGERNAHAADTIGPTADEVRAGRASGPRR